MFSGMLPPPTAVCHAIDEHYCRESRHVRRGNSPAGYLAQSAFDLSFVNNHVSFSGADDVSDHERSPRFNESSDKSEHCKVWNRQSS